MATERTPRKTASAKDADTAADQDAATVDEQPVTDEPTAPVDDEPRYSRDRVLDPAEGPRITDLPYPVIVGALDGDNSHHFTRAQVLQKADEFLGRTVHQEA